MRTAATPMLWLVHMILTLVDAFVRAKIRVGDTLYLNIDGREMSVQVQHLKVRPKLLGGPAAMLGSKEAKLFWATQGWDKEPPIDPRSLREMKKTKPYL